MKKLIMNRKNIIYFDFINQEEIKKDEKPIYNQKDNLSSYIVDINSIISSIINPVFDKAQTKSSHLRINNSGSLEYKSIYSEEDESFKIHEKLKGTKIQSFIEMGDERGL